ncbi:MAG: hypothetical protein WC997_13870 [Porticoccaceae bacterium]
MTHIRTFTSIAILASAALTASAWAATGNQSDSHHPARDTVAQVAQAQSGGPGAGMRAGTSAPDYASQMKAMQQMHEEMMAAKTPEERNALMDRQMKLMHGSMNMMGGMSTMGRGMGAAPGKPADMATRQDMLEQRMDMMQSMMQMMTDRLQALPATK